MKKLLIALAAAFIATTSFAGNVMGSVSTVFNKEETTKIEKQKNQPFILQKASEPVKTSLAQHYSHSSHVSHGSHSSHASHSSHYSGW